MKRIVYLMIAGTVLSLSACKSSQNAYKEAYEKAVADEPKAVVEEPPCRRSDLTCTLKVKGLFQQSSDKLFSS